jgi:small conductance mechanosensitive channel
MTVILPAMTWAGTTMPDELTISAADLERLRQQLDDPQQHEQLLKTLQGLIWLAKQPRSGVPPQEGPSLFADESQGLFLAFGELTQYVGPLGRRLGQEVAAIPAQLGKLPRLFSDPEMLGLIGSIFLGALIIIVVGIILRRLMQQIDAKLRARDTTYELPRRWWKAVPGLMTVGLAVAPYLLLLILSGIVFSVLPVGAVIAGLAALVISMCLLYHLLHALVRALLEPEAPTARLLPINDDMAQQLWRWSVRLIALLVIYLGLTHALRTVGVGGAVYQLVQGCMLVVCASLVSVMIWRVTLVLRSSTIVSEHQPRRSWSSASEKLQKIWPVIVIAYVWCMTLLALFSSRSGATFLVGASLQMALVIGASLALFWGGELLFQRVAVLNDRVGRYLPGLERRTLRYLNLTWWSFRVLITLASLLIVLHLWGVDIVWFFTSPFGGDLVARLATLLATVAIVMGVIDLSTFLSQKLIEPREGSVEASKKRRTLVPLTATIIKYSALFAGMMIVLHTLGVNVTPILAGVGILSLAVGFGAQSLVKDIINGLFILVEDSLAIGDVVNIRGTGGVVEAVNLRTIWLRDLQGSVHIIPNSQVEAITNLTKDYSYYVLEVNVAYREDTDAVIAALREIDSDLQGDPAFAADLLAPIEILGVDRFTDSAVVITARLKTRPIKQWSVGREFNRRMKKLFDARGIEMPFPQRTISWGGPMSEAASMPLKIQALDRSSTTTTRDHRQGATQRRGQTEAQ